MEILKSIEPVIENSKYVKINLDKLNNFCRTFKYGHIKHWLYVSPFDFSTLNDENKLNFLFVFNSISFSYWGEPKWSIEMNGQKLGGAFSMLVALGRALDNGIPILNMDWLSNISNVDFEKITESDIKIPLLTERVNILRDVSLIVINKFDGKFSNVIRKANKDAIKLLDILVSDFKSFEDTSVYNKKQVFFYKRAQLLISDIYQVFKNKEWVSC